MSVLKNYAKAAEVFGFTFRGGKGSHRIYVREGVEELMNFQNVKGKETLSGETTYKL
jgi:predicted RNA binding protein YcfA (HicA-like mRNA interferase family)